MERRMIVETLPPSHPAVFDPARAGEARMFGPRAWVRCALVLLFLAGTASAASYPMQFGTRDFDLPAPAGHQPTSMYFPEMVRTFQAFVPPGMRVAEVYLTMPEFNTLNNGGTPALDSTMQVHVLTATEDRPLSAEGFAEFTASLEQGLPRLLPTGTRFAGIDSREPWGLFYTTANTGADGRDETWVATGTVVVNYQLLNLVHYVEAKVPGAREKARDGVLAWAREVRAANPDKAWLAERAGKLDPALIAARPAASGTGGGDSSLPGTIGRVLGIALFFYIVYRIFRRRR
jgi:hypothetical protein